MLEAKHRGLLQEKSALSLERANLERELKSLRSQTAKHKQVRACLCVHMRCPAGWLCSVQQAGCRKSRSTTRWRSSAARACSLT